MGLHYVPKLYLRGFADRRERLWAYDRTERRFFFSTIDNVAQESKFYSDDLERTLCREVETPAAPVFRAIMSREPIASEQKTILARYLAAQLKRVPAGKQRYHELFPSIATQILDGVSRRIDVVVGEDPSLETIGERRKSEVDELLGRYLKDPPNEIWYETIGPRYLDTMAGAIGAMSWRFFFCSAEDQLLTNDNPVFFFGGLGMGNDNSELSFPVAHNVAMCADRRFGSDLAYYDASSPLVKELNRRTVSAASRFVYARENQSWVSEFSYKKHPRLKSIR